MPMTRTLARALPGLVAAALLSIAPVRAADTVIIGTVGSPSANLWPLFIGIDKGFFTAENVKVDLIYIPASANAIQQLAAGSLDMSFSTGLVDPIRAAEQGAGLGIARFEIQAPPYALIAKPAIKSLKELKGKVISVGGPKDITRIYVDRMLAPHGLKTGDYDYVYAGATTARAQALLARRSRCRDPAAAVQLSAAEPGLQRSRPDHRICAGAGVLGHDGQQGLGRPQSRRAQARAGGAEQKHRVLL